MGKRIARRKMAEGQKRDGPDLSPSGLAPPPASGRFKKR